MLDSVSSTITLADGSVINTIGSAKVLMNIPSGNSIKIVFKVIQNSANGYKQKVLGNCFINSYDVLNSEKRLRHIRTGSSIPFTKEFVSSYQENFDFALTLTDPVAPLSKNLMPSKQTSTDVLKADVAHSENKNLFSRKLRFIDEQSNDFRNLVSETQQYRTNDSSPEPLRDK